MHILPWWFLPGRKVFRGYPVQLVENGNPGGLTVLFKRKKITEICIDDAGRKV